MNVVERERARAMEGHVFKNWAETHSCRPELYFEPRDQHELRQVLFTQSLFID